MIATLHLFSLGIFSESTARGLEFYSTVHPGFMETAQYVKFVNNIWKIMSVKAPFKGLCFRITLLGIICVVL